MNKEKIIDVFEYVAKANETCGNELIYAITLLHSCMEKSLDTVKDQILNATVENRFDELTKLGEYCKGIQEIEKQILDCNSAICLLSQKNVLPKNPEPVEIHYRPNGYIDYSYYAVDSTVKHSLDEDFIHSKILRFEFDRKSYDVTSWQDFLLKISELLYAIDGEKMESFVYNSDMNGNSNSFFSHSVLYDRDNKPRNKRIRGTDLYVFTNQSANSIVSLVKRMLIRFNIPLNEVSVFLKADYKDLHR